MNDQDKQKVIIGIANSFLQSVTVNQTLMILQDTAKQRAEEEVEAMNDEQLEEVLTNIRAQEIARDLREQNSEPEASAQDDSELTSEEEEVVNSEEA
tara:strand:- start:507 stop:797 length:291 start_codon:yes stop_codon:yes gene_type:complete